MAVKPEDASTVILLREAGPQNNSEFEVLMVLRHARSQFVPSAYVFPGGKIDEDDCSREWEELCHGISLTAAGELLELSQSPERALGPWVAGIRETFEEAGILLAVHKNGSPFHPRSPEEIERVSIHRRDLAENRRTFRDLIQEESILLAADELHYFSHWITPEPLPIRFDARFFVARAPQDQIAAHDGVEVTAHVWRTPNEILSDFRNGRFNMILPTIVTIEALAGFSTIEDVIHSTKNKKIRGILTTIKEEDGDIIEYMPDGTLFRHRLPKNE